MHIQYPSFFVFVNIAITSLLLTVAGIANAQMLPGCELISDSPTLTTTIPRIQGYLKSKNFPAVEDEWQDKLTRVSRPGYPDLLLYVEIQRVMTDDPAFEPIIEQWKSERPNSFFAHLSSGIYRAALGYKKRGTAFAKDTSKEQFDAMAIEHKKGLVDLERASSLGKSSAIPLAAMMNILRSQAGIDVNLNLLRQADKVDVNNLSARNSRIKSITPAWGGSNELLDTYYAEISSSSLAESSVRFLKFSILSEQARDYELVSKEKRKAIEIWKKATALCQYAEAPLRSIIRTAYDLEAWLDVRDAASKLIAVLPHNAQVHSQRGWAHEKLANYAEMEKDYVKASDLGWVYAQNRIGYFYMTGQHVQKDLTKVKKYLQMAVDNGNPHAPENLRWLNQYGDKK